MKIRETLHRITVIFAMLLAPAMAGAAEIPHGSEIADGIVVHMTPKGVHFMEAQVPAIIPDSLAVPDQGGTLFSCLLSSNKWKIKDTTVYIDVAKVQIIPLEGKLKLHLELLVSATARVETNGCLFNNGCDVTLPASPVVADTIIDLQMVPDPITGRPKVDATTQQFEIGLAMADPQINGCLLGDFFEFLIGIFGGLVEDAVVGAINGQVGPLLEPAIEDAFNSLALQGTMDLAGTAVDYDFYPTKLELHPGTIGIVMGGSFTSPQIHPCADPARGSYSTPSAVPVFTDYSPASQPYDLAASVADDLLNQLFFSAWRGGLLCREISELNGEPLTTSFLNLIGGSITKVVTPDGPMIISILAPEPPLVAMGAGGNTASVSLSNLSIDIMADVDERLARVMRLTLSPTAGLNVSMNANNEIVAALNFDPANVNASVTYNELAPDANEAILALIPTLVQQLLPSLGEAIPPIAIPDMGGITVDYAEITPDGPGGDFLSFYAGLGGQVQPGGCSAGGTGCGVDLGGAGACSIGGARSAPGTYLVSPFLLLGGIVAIAARRKRA